MPVIRRLLKRHKKKYDTAGIIIKKTKGEETVDNQGERNQMEEFQERGNKVVEIGKMSVKTMQTVKDCETVAEEAEIEEEVKSKIEAFGAENQIVEFRKTKDESVGGHIVRNEVKITGMIVSDFMYSHTIFGERFYTVEVMVYRLSEITDRVPLLISERLIDVSECYLEKWVSVDGELRSYNRFVDGKNRLILTVFVQNFDCVGDEEKEIGINHIYLDGYICKKPVYRRTPLGREIADLLLAVNRSYSKSDYLPCICWGRNARFMGQCQVGDHIRLWGRIQSRAYQKKLDSDEIVRRVAYEVSINRIECVGADKKREEMVVNL